MIEIFAIDSSTLTEVILEFPYVSLGDSNEQLFWSLMLP